MISLDYFKITLRLNESNYFFIEAWRGSCTCGHGVFSSSCFSPRRLILDYQTART